MRNLQQRSQRELEEDLKWSGDEGQLDDLENEIDRRWSEGELEESRWRFLQQCLRGRRRELRG